MDFFGFDGVFRFLGFGERKGNGGCAYEVVVAEASAVDVALVDGVYDLFALEHCGVWVRREEYAWKETRGLR